MALKLNDIIKYLGNIFEKKKKNAVLLPNDTALSSNLKILKVGKEDTPIEISKTEVKVKGTINADSINVDGSSVMVGMILFYADIGLNETRVTYNLTNSYVVPTDEWGVTFVAPLGGNVEIFAQLGQHQNNGLGTGDLYAGLSDAGAVSGYNTIGSQYEQRLLDETVRSSPRQGVQNTWTLTGLTPGTSYSRWIGVKYSGGAADIVYGGTGTGHYPSLILKVTALPITITT